MARTCSSLRPHNATQSSKLIIKSHPKRRTNRCDRRCHFSYFPSAFVFQAPRRARKVSGSRAAADDCSVGRLLVSSAGGGVARASVPAPPSRPQTAGCVPLAEASRQAGSDHRRRRRLVCRQARIGRARRLHEHIKSESEACGHGAVDAKMDAERRSQTIIISSRGEPSEFKRESAMLRSAPLMQANACMDAHIAWASPTQRVGARTLRMRSLHRASYVRASAESRRRTLDGTNASGHHTTRSQSELRQFGIASPTCPFSREAGNGERRDERNSPHEETTVIEHGRADGRTRHGVSPEHAERCASAGRRTIERRRATARARRASATEGARPG
jgi:hypothetical protein